MLVAKFESCGQDFICKMCFMSADLTHLNTSELARSSHSVVVWNDYMIVFGGYQFTEGNGTTGISSPQLLRYNLKLELWEALISNSSVQPDPRYGHTSVLYNVREGGWEVEMEWGGGKVEWNG